LRARLVSIAALVVIGCTMLGGLLVPYIYPMTDEEIMVARRAVEGIVSPQADRAFLVRASPPSPAHPLGTSHVGLDIFALVLWGIRPIAVIAAGSTVAVIVVGTFLGVVAGYAGGRVDAAVLGLCGVTQPFANLVTYIFLLMLLSPKLITIIIILSMTNWVPVARVVRGEVLKLKHIEFVEAAVSLGGEEVYVAARHIVPNLTVIPAMAADAFSQALLLTSSLSFIGVNYYTSISPIDLGQLVASGYRFLRLYWWESILPGVALMLIVLAFNFVGLGLEEKRSGAWV